jgi:peptidoglycan hydrolase-like protein with peptidoglycan-binding domain
MLHIRKSIIGTALGLASVVAPFVAVAPAHAATPTTFYNAPPTLSPGVTRMEVLTLKHELGTIRKDTALMNATNATYDPATVLLVKNYQTFVGITADGVVGPTTWAWIFTGVDNNAAGAVKTDTSRPAVKAVATTSAGGRIIQISCPVGTNVVAFAFDETQPLSELGNMAPCTNGVSNLTLSANAKRMLGGVHTYNIYAYNQSTGYNTRHQFVSVAW